ncbi:MAG: lipoyl synthase, partial [Verrucomicrobiota bacterium]
MLESARKPDWLRAKLPSGPDFLETKKNVDEHKLHTVCQSAQCPNMGECWSRGSATVMILGNVCTRSCTFCAVLEVVAGHGGDDHVLEVHQGDGFGHAGRFAEVEFAGAAG